jgi:hypothetical protein
VERFIPASQSKVLLQEPRDLFLQIHSLPAEREIVTAKNARS